MLSCEALQHENKACNLRLSVLGSHEDRLKSCSLGAYASEEGACHELCVQLFGADYVHCLDTAQGASFCEQTGDLSLKDGIHTPRTACAAAFLHCLETQAQTAIGRMPRKLKTVMRSSRGSAPADGTCAVRAAPGREGWSHAYLRASILAAQEH